MNDCIVVIAMMLDEYERGKCMEGGEGVFSMRYAIIHSTLIFNNYSLYERSDW